MSSDSEEIYLMDSSDESGSFEIEDTDSDGSDDPDILLENTFHESKSTSFPPSPPSPPPHAHTLGEITNTLE